jgi:putative hemolysin
MRPVSFYLTLFAFLLMAGCVAPTATPAPEPTADIPAGVIAARDAVTGFMHEGAILCVPPEGATWQPATAQAPDGFGAYAFTAEECTILVTYPLAAPGETLYHANLTNDELGCCWQAQVDSSGQIVATGQAAAVEASSPAALYCQQQGHTYEVATREDGTQCCTCTFADGSTCDAWAYFRGECPPSED